jgi:hypothetical protein
MAQFFVFDQNYLSGEREVDALRAFTPLNDLEAIRDAFSELVKALVDAGVLSPEKAVSIAGSGARVRQ